MSRSLVADVRSRDMVDEPEDLLHKQMDLELVANTATIDLPFAHCGLIAVGAEKRLTTGVPDNHVYVYRGELRPTSDVYGKVHKVVVKLATRARSFEALTREGELYAGPLADMADRAVPYCYGVFKVANRTADDEENGCAFGCLILADLGEPVESFTGVEETFKIRLANVLMELHHKKHIAHGQIYSCNVFDKNGWPILVDFSRAKFNHQCKFVLDSETLKNFGSVVKPKARDLSCKELYAVADAVKLWRPSPPELTAKDAFDDAHDAIIEYYNEWMPDTGRGRAYVAALKKNYMTWFKEFQAMIAKNKRLQARDPHTVE